MTTNLKLILAAALFAAPLPAFAQSALDVRYANRTPAATRYQAAIAVCEREHRACLAVVEALEDGSITPGELRDIQCRAEEFTARDASQLPHCDTASWNPPFEPASSERHVITLEDICADAGPEETTFVTDEGNTTIECPFEPRNTP